MNRIAFPLKPRMQGASVADLQAALRLLLDRRAVLADDEGAKQELIKALLVESLRQTYDKATQRLVSAFQVLRGLPASGEVDEPTANTLNALLREFGAIDAPPVNAEAPLPDARYTVTCRVVNASGRPVAGLRVEAFQQGRGGIDDRLGEPAATDDNGQAVFRFKRSDLAATASKAGPDLYFKVYRGDAPLDYLLPGDSADNGVIRNFQPQRDPVVLRVDKDHVVAGMIVRPDGLPAAGLTLRVYNLVFGGGSSLLGSPVTDSEGRYVLAYDPGAGAINMEIRAADPQDANNAIPLMKPRFAAAPLETLHLIAPAAPLEAEYRRLSADILPHVAQMRRLAGAREDDERQDITVLNRATGWDARLVALASMAERLSMDADLKLPQEAVYGLLRAGLPSDKLMLAQVDADAAEEALRTARDAGIVGFTDQQIGQFKQQFAEFSNNVRLMIPAPGSRSTYGVLLKATGINEDAQARFAHVYLSHDGDAAQLWENARKAGLDDAQIGKLQLHGKLAFLSGNSDEMTTRLMQRQVNDPAQLVERDFYDAGPWVNEIHEAAGVPPNRRANLTDDDRRRLDAVIPAAYEGTAVEDRINAYAEDMARKVRLSYPTRVIGRLIERDNAGTFGLGAGRDGTATLLRNAAGRGFRLGETPVEAFLKAHADVASGMPDNVYRGAVQQLKTLQRLYQITPSNEAMPVLTSLGMTSAYDVMAYPEAEFRALYSDRHFKLHGKRPTEAECRVIYRKSKQVSSVTYNLFTIAAQFNGGQPLPVTAPAAQVREAVRNELVKHFPTMESLFGSTDYCECEHCRSVLSPAAYLVDLLQFVDIEPGVWGNFLAQWKAAHNGQDYPHKDRNGAAMKPYDVLTERRPDLPYIQLTCENTNTALPYIDIVNEILEYYVANGRMEAGAAQDTAGASTTELLAEPHNVISGAYDKLREARYPLNLPFDLWAETTRRFFNYLETPLADVLETFREGDDLFAAARPIDRYGIFMESLGLSPAEAEIFTDPAPLGRWYELYGFATAAEATTEATDASTGQRIDLNSAQALSRRLGVTYKEIADIVQTGFVNPEIPGLGLLYKLGVAIQDARLYKDCKPLYEQNKDLVGSRRDALSSADQQRFDNLSNVIANRQETGWEVVNELAAFEGRLGGLAAAFNVPLAQLQTYVQDIRFDKVLVLADSDAGCNFDLTTLRYAGGAKADPIAFLRINLFTRLWRKLGWSIEETDRALSAFIPRSAPFVNDAACLARQPLKTALIYIAHLKALDEKVKVGKQGRLKLLTLWSDIAVNGKKPLYAQLFLTCGALKADTAFDNPLRQYLTDPNVKMKDHLPALQGALGLTANEIDVILKDAGKSFVDAGLLAAAELSLPNVSLLFRYGLLTRALKLPMRDIIALKRLSGLDPFKSLHPDPLTTIADDHPFSQTLRFVETVGLVGDGGLKIEDLEYLLRHRFNETGRYRSNPQATLALLKMLATGVRAIRAGHAVPDDPGVMTNDVLRQKLGLILPADVVERFMAMLDGTAEFTSVVSGVAAGDKLISEGFAGELSVREVRYNAVRQEQKLTFRGVLFDAEKSALKNRLPKPVPPNPHVPSPALGGLLDDVQRQAQQFFEKYLQKQAPNVQPAAGFLEAADFSLLFEPMPQALTGKEQQERIRRQRGRLARTFLPFLQQRLIRQLIVQTMIAHTGAEPALVEGLLTDERLLSGPGPLVDAFAAVAERGLTATFFTSADCTGAALATVSLDGADTGLKDKDGRLPRPSGANSAKLEGYLEVPAASAYRFYVLLDKRGAEAELRLYHLPDPVFLRGTASADNVAFGDQPNEYLDLKPDVPYRFTLVLKNLGNGEARLLVQGETLPKGGLERLVLYPFVAMAAAERAVALLGKALQFTQGLGLSEREVRYFSTHAGAFDRFNLSLLPTCAGDATPALSEALFGQFLRMAGYSRMKRELAGGTDDLIDIFEANGIGAPDKVYPLIARLARRDAAMVKDCAEALFHAPAFADERPVQRLWEGLQAVERFGVPVASLLDWTRIVGKAVPAGERFEIARGLKEAVKARFEPDAWQRAAQPIFDSLRRGQRDALVAHVMHQRRFDRMEQLYEYFLIDPGMEPVVQTSRIRLAIASVQLFIQRCLLNLEQKAHPTTINSRQWEWMKRYRVWEANRKIFLFPENWLEPEFRDDKTHLFAELEGALLQGDVSADMVDDAFLNYLKKMDELARLDIVAQHIEDNADSALRVLHVFGRTYSLPHKYFYRRYEHQMWTPWEPVSAEIEGDHLAPVVWRDRLYLFWVTFMDRPDPNAKPAPVKDTNDNERTIANLTVSQTVDTLANMAAHKIVEVQLYWSEYLNGAWATRSSGGFSAVLSRLVSQNFEPGSAFIHVSKAYEAGEERGVYIHLAGEINSAFYLAGRNSAPEGADYDANKDCGGSRPDNPFSGNEASANRYKGRQKLDVEFRERITTGSLRTTHLENSDILRNVPNYTLLPCDNNLTTLGVSEEAYRTATRPDAVKDAIESGLDDIATLMRPVFYQDNVHTFFVEPDVTERTIEKWQGWVTRAPRPKLERKKVVIVPEKPRRLPGHAPADPQSGFKAIDRGALIDPTPECDWLVNPGTVLDFDNALVGPVGRLGLQILANGGHNSFAAGLAPVDLNPGANPARGSNVVLTGSDVLREAGLIQAGGGLNIVNRGGFNAVNEKNLKVINGSTFRANGSIR